MLQLYIIRFSFYAETHPFVDSFQPTQYDVLKVKTRIQSRNVDCIKRNVYASLLLILFYNNAALHDHLIQNVNLFFYSQHARKTQ